jgi:hypothetical protein
MQSRIELAPSSSDHAIGLHISAMYLLTDNDGSFRGRLPAVLDFNKVSERTPERWLCRAPKLPAVARHEVLERYVYRTFLGPAEQLGQTGIFLAVVVCLEEYGPIVRALGHLDIIIV